MSRQSSAEVLVVVVAYRSDGVLASLLASLAGEGSPSCRVIVVDNARSAATQTLVGRLALSFPGKVEYIESRGNVGYAAGVNYGLNALDGEPAILIVNPDARLSPGSLVALRDALRDPQAAIVGPLLIDESGRPFDAHYRTPSLFSQLLFLLHLNHFHRLGRLSGLTLRPLTTSAVDWVSGACMLVDAAALSKIGLMDDRYFMYMEDEDWCRTARKRGYKVLWCPYATAVHIGGYSAAQAAARTYSQSRLAKLIHSRKWHKRTRFGFLVSLFVLEALGKFVLATLLPSRRTARGGPEQFLRAIAAAARFGLVRAQYARMQDSPLDDLEFS